MADSDTGVVWFRRDLRVRDHPALRAALDEHERVVCVFCFDDRLLHGRHESGPRTQFLLECLADLDGELRARGGGLAVRHGKPERELVALARQAGADTIHVTQDVSPFARKRGERGRSAFADAGIELRSHPGLNAVDVREVSTKAGKPYSVFSPFHRTWLATDRRPVLDAPRELSPLPSAIAKGMLPTLESLGLDQEVDDPARGGEAEAGQTLDRFLDGPIRDYADNHDALGRDKTSRLSPYLHFGCIGTRQIEERLPRGKGPEAFHRQLCWRDFYHHVLLNFPRNARVGVSGPIPGQDPLEPRAAPVRGLDAGPHRLSARRRRDAPAAARGLDAQPGPARGRLVSHQGPRHRLALGRALVHAAADRR